MTPHRQAISIVQKIFLSITAYRIRSRRVPEFILAKGLGYLCATGFNQSHVSLAVSSHYRIVNAGGTTSSMFFPVQCHLGTLSHTCSPFA